MNALDRVVAELAGLTRDALAAEQTRRLDGGRARLDGRRAVEAFCDGVVRRQLDELDHRRVASGEARLSAADEDAIAQRVLDFVAGLGPPERLLSDPAPRKGPRLMSIRSRVPLGTTARTGELCPESGVWEVVGSPSTTAPIAQGNRMPPYDGNAVTWRLKQYA